MRCSGTVLATAWLSRLVGVLALPPLSVPGTVLVLEAVHLRAPRGVFGFHLGGDVEGRGGVRLLRLRGGGESEQWDGGFGEE